MACRMAGPAERGGVAAAVTGQFGCPPTAAATSFSGAPAGFPGRDLCTATLHGTRPDARNPGVAPRVINPRVTSCSVLKSSVWHGFHAWAPFAHGLAEPAPRRLSGILT